MPLVITHNSSAQTTLERALAYPACRRKHELIHRQPPKGGFVIVARGFIRRAGLARDVGNHQHMPQWTGAEPQGGHRFSRGSRASRRPSPTNEKDSMVIAISRVGNSPRCQYTRI